MKNPSPQIRILASELLDQKWFHPIVPESRQRQGLFLKRGFMWSTFQEKRAQSHIEDKICRISLMHLIIPICTICKWYIKFVYAFIGPHYLLLYVFGFTTKQSPLQRIIFTSSLNRNIYTPWCTNIYEIICENAFT